jgi:hypothetical protein
VQLPRDPQLPTGAGRQSPVYGILYVTERWKLNCQGTKDLDEGLTQNLTFSYWGD